MKKSIFLALVASIALAACSKAPEQPPVAEAKQPWAEYVANVIDEYYRRNPESAVDAGLHQYDGQMSDFSAEALAEYTSWLDSVLAEASSYTELEGIEAFERDYLSTALGGELFWIRESGFLNNNPLIPGQRECAGIRHLADNMDGFPFAGIIRHHKRGILYPGSPDFNNSIIGIRFMVLPPSVGQFITVGIDGSFCAQCYGISGPNL